MISDAHLARWTDTATVAVAHYIHVQLQTQLLNGRRGVSDLRRCLLMPQVLPVQKVRHHLLEPGDLVQCHGADLGAQRRAGLWRPLRSQVVPFGARAALLPAQATETNNQTHSVAFSHL